jgi:hypothetical protein
MSCHVSSRAPRARPGAPVWARSRPGRPRALAVLALLAVGCSWVVVAPAGADTGDEAPPAIAADEIFLDLKTQRFSAPIRAEKGTVVKIAVHAPTDSQVVLAYWPTTADCPRAGRPPTAPGAGVERRAGAPGQAVGGIQKYVISVGPLKILEEYCFHATVSHQKPLDEWERKLVGDAVTAAIRAVTTPGLVHEPGCEPEGAAIRVCQLGAQLEKHLGPLRDTTVFVRGGTKAVRIRTAFEDLIRSRGNVVTDLVNQSLVGVENEASNRDDIEKRLRSLRENVEKWGAGARASYDPLSLIDPRAIEVAGKQVRFTAFLRSDELKEQFPRRVLEDKKLFNKTVWDLQDKLQDSEGDAAARERLPTEQEDQLQALLYHPEPPLMISISGAQLSRLISAMQDKDAADIGPEIEAMKGLFPATITDVAALTGLPGFKSSDPMHGRLLLVMATQSALARALSGLEKARSDALALGNSAVMQAFREELQRVSRRTTRGAMQYSSTYTERFPLSVGADVGVGFAFLGQDRQDAFTYFGLSVYATPVYKDEPLAGADWRRRLSVILGITVNSPSLNDDAKVRGLFGGRMLLGGLGWRGHDYLRLGAGALLFKQESVNPLSSREALRVGFYASLSLDLDVIGTVVNWFGQATNALR